MICSTRFCSPKSQSAAKLFDLNSFRAEHVRSGRCLPGPRDSFIRPLTAQRSGDLGWKASRAARTHRDLIVKASHSSAASKMRMIARPRCCSLIHLDRATVVAPVAKAGLAMTILETALSAASPQVSCWP